MPCYDCRTDKCPEDMQWRWLREQLFMTLLAPRRFLSAGDLIVDQAPRAGVSSDTSTTDIMERQPDSRRALPSARANSLGESGDLLSELMHERVRRYETQEARWADTT